MSNDSKRRILVLLTRTTAGFSWLFVLPVQLRGHTNNPYMGIVVLILIFIPVIFVFGLLWIAFGVFLARGVSLWWKTTLSSEHKAPVPGMADG